MDEVRHNITFCCYKMKKLKVSHKITMHIMLWRERLKIADAQHIGAAIIITLVELAERILSLDQRNHSLITSYLFSRIITIMFFRLTS